MNVNDSALSAMPLGCMGTERWFLGDRNERRDDVKRTELPSELFGYGLCFLQEQRKLAAIFVELAFARGCEVSGTPSRIRTDIHRLKACCPSH